MASTSFSITTRSRKIAAESLKNSNLNVSYDVVVYDDKPSLNLQDSKEDDKLTTEELLVDLRCKLASCNSANDMLNEENKALKIEIESRNAKLLYLDEKLNNFLYKARINVGTQTVEVDSLIQPMKSIECQMEVQLSNTAFDYKAVNENSSVKQPSLENNTILQRAEPEETNSIQHSDTASDYEAEIYK